LELVKNHAAVMILLKLLLFLEASTLSCARVHKNLLCHDAVGSFAMTPSKRVCFPLSTELILRGGSNLKSNETFSVATELEANRSLANKNIYLLSPLCKNGKKPFSIWQALFNPEIISQATLECQKSSLSSEGHDRYPPPDVMDIVLFPLAFCPGKSAIG
jgi:hypothetical protein